ncbi:hypothetical protein [Thauera sedimentorum]|nr:hypothetical protein [Thauera sedimentorum]
MSKHNTIRTVSLTLCSAFVLSACVSNPFNKSSDQAGEASDSSKTATAAQTEQKPAEQKSSAIPPGMNANGEVVDSTKIEAGHGQQVKGLNDWEGEITGKPFPGSKFTKLKIGMPMRQVMDLIGQPSDQGSYVTGKAWIPFYFGADRYRHELIYKGQGRLIFSGGSVGDWSSGHLTWIIFNKNEGAYR